MTQCQDTTPFIGRAMTSISHNGAAPNGKGFGTLRFGLFHPWEDKERLERGVTVSNDSRTLQDASPAGITHYMAGNGIELEPNMRIAHKFAVLACPERRPERCRATTVLRAP